MMRQACADAITLAARPLQLKLEGSLWTMRMCRAQQMRHAQKLGFYGARAIPTTALRSVSQGQSPNARARAAAAASMTGSDAMPRCCSSRLAGEAATMARAHHP